MKQIEIYVKTVKDIARLKKLLESQEWKSFYIYSVSYHCGEDSLLYFLSVATLKGKLKFLWEYIKCRLSLIGCRQVFFAYNVKCQVYAYVFKPWTIALRDYGGYNYVYRGWVEKAYWKPSVELAGHEIWVEVDMDG